MHLLRTLLFVPAGRDDMLEKAPGRGADALVLDLEDAVLPAGKPAAREAARRRIAPLRDAGQRVFARINGIGSGLTRDDLLAVAVDGLAGVVLPKAQQAQDLRDLDVLLREAEVQNGVRPGDIGVIPLIESARGLLRCEEIATATDRVVGLSFGAEDYTGDLGVRRTPDGVGLAHARYTIATVASAYGLLAIDTPYTDFADEEGLVAETRFARDVGFHGKYVVHPAQVAPVNLVFTPAAEDVAQARRIVDAFEAAASADAGAVQLEGRMIDAPIAERARRLIELAASIEQRRNR
jgi:citrate lyase subunit beta/citryl-CoA lyase